MTTNVVDLRTLSFEGFLSFLFEQPIVPFKERQKTDPGPWYWSVEVIFNPQTTARHYLRLFVDPLGPLARYSDAQIEQGFWAIQSSTLDCAVCELIWESRIALDVRESLVRAMHPLFATLFSQRRLDSAPEMWGDSLAFDWGAGRRLRSRGGEDLIMQDVMFDTLSKILELPAGHLQHAALHGLGHLCHPGTPPLIEQWIQRTLPMDAHLVEYARAAARFDVM